MKGYREDLAYIHDAGFGDFARQGGPGILKIFRQQGHCGGTVVDLGCGSGIWARQLVDAGYRVVGIDRSAAMLVLARRRAPQATFRRGSFLKVRLPRCDAVTALGEVFNYTFDSANGEAELSRLFRSVFTVLRPGGVFLFDIAGRRRAPRRRTQSFTAGARWAVLVERQADARRQTLVRRITTFRKVGRLYRRTEEVHRLNLYRSANIKALLRHAGFRVRLLGGYGALRFAPGLTAFLACKSRTQSGE